MKAIVVHERDNVATALEDLMTYERVTFRVGDVEHTVVVTDSIPFGYKFAIHDIPTGNDIYKYGKSIGKSQTAITCGMLVHNHNVN